MIRYIILEDEPAAARRLQKMMIQLHPDWILNGIADSVVSGIELIEKNNFDLILSDIELSDGNCFQVYSQFSELKPIVFITAFDAFALKAFEFNGIHYLLKPIEIGQLKIALERFQKTEIGSVVSSALLKHDKKELPQKLLSKVGATTVVIDYNEIAAIYLSNKSTKTLLFSERTHYLDQSLDKLMSYLPQSDFFRISRRGIVNRKAVRSFSTISSNRLLLVTQPKCPQEMIVSKDKTPLFKRWMGAK